MTTAVIITAGVTIVVISSIVVFAVCALSSQISNRK